MRAGISGRMRGVSSQQLSDTKIGQTAQAGGRSNNSGKLSSAALGELAAMKSPSASSGQNAAGRRALFKKQARTVSNLPAGLETRDKQMYRV